jgi:hypothetical protein
VVLVVVVVYIDQQTDEEREREVLSYSNFSINKSNY